MTNYLLTIRFDGSSYHGWQFQENAISVQQRIMEAAARMFGEKTVVNGCSRTDAGVHANRFCCNFKAPRFYPCGNVIAAMNTYLPDDIAVLACEVADDDFHARFSCKGKEYEYVVWNAPVRDPFLQKRAYHYKYPIDVQFLDKQAKDLLGTHDFTCFMASGSEAKTTVRTITRADVRREGDKVIFTFGADGFLYNMVRIMTGTLLYISAGKIAPDTIPAIIESKDRLQAGITVPGDGLYLNRIYY
ncbi:MAG: tRNA pseudouridine(38-40) synthase TruA [Ruminococcaceae bacterium]|nr:tRNA pseudouridine(38-40) synthase TruA [Oscillospiraceae bacterium]